MGGRVEYACKNYLEIGGIMTQLKDMLNPPFLSKEGDDVIWDRSYLRRYARISYPQGEKGKELVKEWIMQAMNEKWDRDFGIKPDKPSRFEEILANPKSAGVIEGLQTPQRDEITDEEIDAAATYADEVKKRDFGEPMRWVEINRWKSQPDYQCPKCKWANLELSVPYTLENRQYNHCPSCGQRLLPPEEK